MGNRISASEARRALPSTLDGAEHRGERWIIQRRGKDVAAIIPFEDLKLLVELEDRIDLEAMRDALAESDERIPWEKAKERLGL